MKLQDINFRIWDSVKKHYVPFAFLGNFNVDYNISPEYGVVRETHKNDNFCMIEVCDDKAEVEIELWTGLKDIDGRKIYEGDIVRAVSDYSDDVLIVKKHKEGTWFLSTKGGDYRGSMIYLVEDEDYRLEVIGNIHENEELL